LFVVVIQLKEDLLQNEERLRLERRQHCDTVNGVQGCWYFLCTCESLIVKEVVSRISYHKIF